VYVCNNGSECSRASELLLLRKENEYWIAYDAAIDGESLYCRQPVFRSTSNILEADLHVWQINKAAGRGNDVGVPPDWQGENWKVQTRHPPDAEPMAIEEGPSV
jgi:hypothetical protein